MLNPNELEQALWRIIEGDSLEMLKHLSDKSVNCCVTSPPYWGLRSYIAEGDVRKPLECGLEKSPEEYVDKLVEVFREVKRVLRDDGTLWLVLGDSYAGSWGNYGGQNRGKGGGQRTLVKGSLATQKAYEGKEAWRPPTSNKMAGIKNKDLVGIPWSVAFALRADGWYLRSDIIWAKKNPMPESVTDRPTKAHEYIFLLAKSKQYYYDYEVIKESMVTNHEGHIFGGVNKHGANPITGARLTGRTYRVPLDKKRNRRSVWTVSTKPYKPAHFAVFPPDLIEPCVLAGCPEGGTVLDPFCGSGTTGMVSLKHGRKFIGIDLNPEYCKMSVGRITQDK